MTQSLIDLGYGYFDPGIPLPVIVSIRALSTDRIPIVLLNAPLARDTYDRLIQ